MRTIVPLLIAYFFLIIGAQAASGQVIDRDMTMLEPTTTKLGEPIRALRDCVVDVDDASAVLDQRIIPASAPTGGGTHTIDLAGKVGFTTITAFCRNNIDEDGASVSLTRTFPGDPPASPTLRD